MISDLPLYTVSRDELELFVKQLEENGCTEILQGLYMIMVRVSIKRERESLFNSWYRYSAWKNVSQSYELINSLDFFFQTYKLYNEDLKFILLTFVFSQVLLSKILLFFSFLVGKLKLLVNRVLCQKQWYLDISEFFPIGFSFLLYLYLILKDCLCVYDFKQLILMGLSYVTHSDSVIHQSLSFSSLWILIVRCVTPGI